jgi:hypothetical protein
MDHDLVVLFEHPANSNLRAPIEQAFGFDFLAGQIRKSHSA